MNTLQNVFNKIATKTELEKHEVKLTIIDEATKMALKLIDTCYEFDRNHIKAAELIKPFETSWSKKEKIDADVSKSLAKRPELIKELQNTYDSISNGVMLAEKYYPEILKDKKIFEVNLEDAKEKAKDLGATSVDFSYETKSRFIIPYNNARKIINQTHSEILEIKRVIVEKFKGQIK